MKSLGIIGFGNMGEAMVQGIHTKHPEIGINIIEKVEVRRKLAVDNYGAIDFGLDYAAFMKASDVIVLAIKPQDIQELMTILHPYSKGARFISIIAGRTLNYFIKSSQANEFARFMPSLAASVGKSVVGVSFSDSISESFRSDATLVAESIGSAFEVPERDRKSVV